MEKYRFILASASPRRKELLGYLNIPLEIIPSKIEEISHEKIPQEVAKDLAKQKGIDVFNSLDMKINPFVVSSDTLVELDGKIFGKPKDREQAKETLLELSGKTHKVHTGVFFKTKDEEKSFVVSTEVTFDVITKELMTPYLNTQESLDKAGAYGIQGAGLTFIKSVNGSYSNVVGFPLNEFVNALKTYLGKNWSDLFV